MAVTFNELKNYYSANFNVNKYEDALVSAIEFRKQKELEHGYL